MDFQALVTYCEIDNLPEGLEEIYNHYELDEKKKSNRLFSHEFLQTITDKYQVPEDKIILLKAAIEAIEGDEKLLKLTNFLVWDMCSARNRCDVDNYQNMTPGCMAKDKEYYSFILLMACVEPSMEMLKERGVPLEYYAKIPYQPMKSQLEKFSETGNIEVKDFGWDMNFYTCAIFLLDRFFFIPYKFGDSFTMYRSAKSQEIVALHHKDVHIRRDGQVDGINDVYDTIGQFKTIWNETESQVTANPINPMGLGYSFELRRLTYPKQISSLGAMPLRFWFANTGTSPCYDDVRLKIRLSINTKSWIVDLDPNDDHWMIGDIIENKIAIMPELKPGNYTVSVGLFSKEKPVLLDIDAPLEDGFYQVGEVEVDTQNRDELFHIWDTYYPEGYYPLEDPQVPEQEGEL